MLAMKHIPHFAPQKKPRACEQTCLLIMGAVHLAALFLACALHAVAAEDSIVGTLRDVTVPPVST